MNKKGLPVVPPAPEPRGYRIEEAAKYMGVTPWFIELKIRSGKLPALKLCRHYTVLREDMDVFLDEERKKFRLRPQGMTIPTPRKRRKQVDSENSETNVGE